MSSSAPSNDLEFVFVLDDDALARRSITRLLESAGYTVRAYASADELIHRKPPTHPCCILLDLQMPDMDGLQIQDYIQEQGWMMPIIFVSGHATVPISVKALKNGALDFLVKPYEEAELLQAVEAALGHARTQYAKHAQQNQAQSLIEQLTDRELEVLAHVLTGKLNKQIADALDISERTVKAHRARIMQKTGANSVAELISLVRASGISHSWKFAKGESQSH